MAKLLRDHMRLLTGKAEGHTAVKRCLSVRRTTTSLLRVKAMLRAARNGFTGAYKYAYGFRVAEGAT